MDASGPLFFPVTPFDEHDEVAYEALGEHVAAGVDAGAGAVYIACGTGEFHALSLGEYENAVATAVTATSGRVAVIAGAGGATGTALEHARIAEARGADGILLMPPYLVTPPQEGLRRYVTAVAKVTPLPMVLYHRANAVFAPHTVASVAEIPNVVGLKDGYGNLELLQDIADVVRLEVPEFALFNGMPTAELTMLAYRGIGVSLYSSATFAFLPAVSMAFYEALNRADDALCERLLAGFYRPLARLRDRTPGYAVALIKAGLRTRGIPVGRVRPPLVDPTVAELAELEAIIASGIDLIEQTAPTMSQPGPSPTSDSSDSA